MSQLLASLDDIQKWLPDDKLVVTDGSTESFQVDVYRLIKSQLSGVFTPVVLAGWDSPDNTPGEIRSIAGRLIAAFVYRKAYSEDIPDIPAYAQRLYDEAMELLKAIRDGTMVLVDEDGNPLADLQLDMSAEDFWPNDSTDGPFFTMDKSFA